jgi:hypothetical protein
MAEACVLVNKDITRAMDSSVSQSMIHDFPRTLRNVLKEMGFYARILIDVGPLQPHSRKFSTYTNPNELLTKFLIRCSPNIDQVPTLAQPVTNFFWACFNGDTLHGVYLIYGRHAPFNVSVPRHNLCTPWPHTVQASKTARTLVSMSKPPLYERWTYTVESNMTSLVASNDRDTRDGHSTLSAASMLTNGCWRANGMKGTVIASILLTPI